MRSANLRVVKDEIPEVRVKVQVDIANSDQQINPKPIALRKGMHLDVDGILARSLPTVRPLKEFRPLQKPTPPTHSDASSRSERSSGQCPTGIL
jgi:hypothetical protein